MKDPAYDRMNLGGWANKPEIDFPDGLPVTF